MIVSFRPALADQVPVRTPPGHGNSQSRSTTACLGLPHDDLDRLEFSDATTDTGVMGAGRGRPLAWEGTGQRGKAPSLVPKMRVRCHIIILKSNPRARLFLFGRKGWRG